MRAACKRFLAAGGLALALMIAQATGAVSGPLDDAKAAGLIGERPDGYVAAVEPNPSPEIAALVERINSKRRAAYAEIAAEDGVPVDQVAALTAEKIRAQAAPGEYFMTPDGGWAQK
jgi:hypothetical protein